MQNQDYKYLFAECSNERVSVAIYEENLWEYPLYLLALDMQRQPSTFNLTTRVNTIDSTILVG